MHSWRTECPAGRPPSLRRLYSARTRRRPPNYRTVCRSIGSRTNYCRRMSDTRLRRAPVLSARTTLRDYRSSRSPYPSSSPFRFLPRLPVFPICKVTLSSFLYFLFLFFFFSFLFFFFFLFF